MAVPVLRMAPLPDGRPHPELRADGPSPRVHAETGGEQLTVLRTRKAVLGCVTSSDWVMAGITADGELRNYSGAEWQDKRGGMLNMNPPDHTTFRKPLNHSFTGTTDDAAGEDAEAVALDLLGRLRGHRTADLAADYADPFAAAVVCRSLGLPPGEWPRILAGSENAFSPVHGVATGVVSSAEWHWPCTPEHWRVTSQGGAAADILLCTPHGDYLRRGGAKWMAARGCGWPSWAPGLAGHD